MHLNPDLVHLKTELGAPEYRTRCTRIRIGCETECVCVCPPVPGWVIEFKRMCACRHIESGEFRIFDPTSCESDVSMACADIIAADFKSTEWPPVMPDRAFRQAWQNECKWIEWIEWMELAPGVEYV